MKSFIRSAYLSVVNLDQYKDWFVILVICLVILIPKVDFITVSGSTTTIRWEDFILAGLYATWCVWAIFHWRALRYNHIHAIILACVILGGLSTIFGIFFHSVTHPLLGILNILRRAEYFFMFVVAYSWLRPANLSKYLQTLIVLCGVLLVICTLQYMAWLPMFSTWQGYSGQPLYYMQNFGFIIATFAGHYELGGYIILMTPLILGSAFLSKTRSVQVAMILILIGFYLLLQVNFSRSAYVGTLICLAVFLIIVKKYWLLILPLIDLVRVIFLYFTGKYSRYDYTIAVINNDPTSTNNHSSTSSATPSATPLSGVNSHLKLNNTTEISLDPSGATRVDVWNNAIHHFKTNPVFGTGYSSIGTGADNQYLRWLGEVGLVGLFSMMALLGTIVYTFFKGAVRTNKAAHKFFLAAVTAGVIGLLAQATLIDIFDSSKVALLLWFLVGLGCLIVEEVKAQ